MKLKGININEVWDYRLSIGNPILYQNGKTWVVKIHCLKDSSVLEEYDSGVPTTGDPYDTSGIIPCYEWLLTVRDKYSRNNLDLRKPVVKLINAAQEKSASITNSTELQKHLEEANRAIQEATNIMHDKIEEIK